MKFEVVTNAYEWNDVSLIGALHIELGGSPFPAQRWSGSVSETLIMWTENLLSLLEAGGKEEFFFVGSADSFTIRLSGASKASLVLLENAKPTEPSVYEVSLFSIVSAVFHTASALISDSRFEEVQQIKRLKNMIQRLKIASEAHGYHMD